MRLGLALQVVDGCVDLCSLSVRFGFVSFLCSPIYSLMCCLFGVGSSVCGWMFGCLLFVCSFGFCLFSLITWLFFSLLFVWE